MNDFLEQHLHWISKLWSELRLSSKAIALGSTNFGSGEWPDSLLLTLASALPHCCLQSCNAFNITDLQLNYSWIRATIVSGLMSSLIGHKGRQRCHTIYRDENWDIKKCKQFETIIRSLIHTFIEQIKTKGIERWNRVLAKQSNDPQKRSTRLAFEKSVTSQSISNELNEI